MLPQPMNRRKNKEKFSKDGKVIAKEDGEKNADDKN